MAYANKWEVIPKDKWRYALLDDKGNATVFTTEWHFSDMMPPQMVDALLGITPMTKKSLTIQYMDSCLCPKCGASGFPIDEYHFCPSCGEQMIFDDEEED